MKKLYNGQKCKLKDFDLVAIGIRETLAAMGHNDNTSEYSIFTFDYLSWNGGSKKNHIKQAVLCKNHYLYYENEIKELILPRNNRIGMNLEIVEYELTQ